MGKRSQKAKQMEQEWRNEGATKLRWDSAVSVEAQSLGQCLTVTGPMERVHGIQEPRNKKVPHMDSGDGSS